MKTLTINRPEGLATFKHEIEFKVGEFDFRKMSKEEKAMVTEFSTTIGGGATAIGNYLLATQDNEGSVLIVNEDVSRDLEVSNIVGELSALAWPSSCLEMRFKDPGLPAVILCSTGIHGKDGEHGIAFGSSGFDQSTITLALPESKWLEYVKGQDAPEMEKLTPYDKGLNAAENDAMKYLAVLAVKVMAYCSVPKLAPTRLVTKAEIKAAGIHPKHLPASKKAFVVKSLPAILRPSVPKEASGEGSGEKRTFMGRRGYIRHFHSDFYKNLKGQWKFIPPIPPPEGIKVTYIVKKV